MKRKALALTVVLGLLLFVGVNATAAMIPLLGSAAVGTTAAPAVAAAVTEAPRPFLVRLAESNLMLAGDPSAEDLDARAWQIRRDEVAAELERLAAAGYAGAYTYVEAAHAFRVDLSEVARDALAGNLHVASVEPMDEVAPAASVGEQAAPLDWGRNGITTQIQASGVSSVVFVQVHSPFMWGRVNVGGLSVRLWLEDGDGNVIGGAAQVVKGTGDNQRCGANPPLDAIKVDPGQLYFETVFRACTTDDPVMIRPGHRVHVMTIDGRPDTPDEDKRITVDAIDAWTSYDHDSVTATVPANSDVVVTITNSTLNLGSGYITPGSSMTYAEVRDEDGIFTVSAFRTSNDPTPRTVDLTQGYRGFVRVIHPNGDEVYSVHGQNVLVLENSSIIHGYAYPLPSAPGGLISGVTVSRPAPVVAITLKDSEGAVKATLTWGAGAPYAVTLGADIIGGDSIEVSINGGPVNEVATVPITASLDVVGNQVVGTAAPSTEVVVGMGRVAGYVTGSSSYTYVLQRSNTNAAGAFASGQFRCGSSNYLNLGPGSFGYVGYEGGRGNFVYAAFAEPANYVMVDYPLVEGWLANGLVRPTITLRDSADQIKSQAVAAPLVTYLSNQKLYLNLYYVHTTAQFVAAGDTVEVDAGGDVVEIPVPSSGIVGALNDESDVVSGVGPAGATLRVIPARDRAARTEVVVAGSGGFAAGNPYTTLNLATCVESTRTYDFAEGDHGRVYLRYADGNEVFAFYGRFMSVNQNENRVELWFFPLRGLDWTSTPSREVSVTLTPKTGSPVTTTKPLGSGHGTIEIVDGSGARVLIRAGDRLDVTFTEGPVSGPTRSATMTFDQIALLTASPDTDDNTVAGVGPTADWPRGGWQGRAWTTTPVTSRVVPIPARHVAAYAPVSFVTASGQPITLEQGYAGKASFSDNSGCKVWVAWAVTSYEVKITGWPRIGDTVVCGKAPPNTTVNIYDVTDPVNRVLIGTGVSDGEGQFCVTVSPPLSKDQVIIAESEGTLSQPYVVREVSYVFLPFVVK